MLNKFFENLQSQLAKKKTAKSASAAKTASKKATEKTVFVINNNDIIKAFAGIVPSHLSVAAASPVDENGMAPEETDFLIFKNYCNDLVAMMGGYVPLELIYATCYVTPLLNKKSLFETLARVVAVKKISFYSNVEERQEFRVPAFIIAGDEGYHIRDVKNEVLNYYNSKNIDSECEVEILAVLNRGLVIKNWRERRSYIALETGPDTLMWLFILMNEYLDVPRDVEIDFRKYIRTEKNYPEY